MVLADYWFIHNSLNKTNCIVIKTLQVCSKTLVKKEAMLETT